MLVRHGTVRSLRRFLSVVVFGVAASAGVVSAHDGHDLYAGPWVSTVTEITAVGVSAVIGGDTVVNVTVEPDVTVEIPGYEGEPYLRISGDGRWQVNTASPSHWINQDPSSIVAPPAHATADAEPVWEPASAGRLLAYHDHRVHWMGAHPERDLTVPFKQHDWEIPVVVDGRDAAIRGELWFDAQAALPPSVRYEPGAAAGSITTADDTSHHDHAGTAGGDRGTPAVLVAVAGLAVAATSFWAGAHVRARALTSANASGGAEVRAD